MVKKWLLYTSKSDAEAMIAQIDSALGYISPETCSYLFEENVESDKRYLLKLNEIDWKTLSESEQSSLLDTYPSDFKFPTVE
tara:strand:+ start:77 stop:322 length:246 start_codon:yes stop_codon:yes gene_type:complete